ncbi:MAG: uncharacterized protein K0R63_866 [Rickettsiales bacterium]|jgi:uncharacterized protein YdbL (DUF1318 family)|nr:uncharacterized protein [Rickettsiales bacterium]
MISKLKLAGLAVALMLLAPAAYAIDIDSAKAKGLVGERPDGYLGAVSSSADAETKALVEEINTKRRAKYQQVSQENNQQLRVVEKVAGEKAIKEHVSPGEYYMDASGKWVKK